MKLTPPHNKRQNGINSSENDGTRTPLWALIGAPVVLFLVSSGTFWGAYSWMSATNPLPSTGTAVIAATKTAPKPVSPVPEAIPLSRLETKPRAAKKAASRQTAAPVIPSTPLPTPQQTLSLPEPRRAEVAPQRQAQVPCPIQVTESRLAQGKAIAPPMSRRVAIVLHRSGSTAEGNHEAERQVIAVVNNLAPADSFRWSRRRDRGRSSRRSR